MGYQRPCGAVFISDSWQGHKNRKPASAEPGTDYGVPYGTEIRAAEAGLVVDAKTSTSGATGRYLTINLDDGRRVRYLHLSAIIVRAGDRVSRGQLVAKSGASANGSEWGVGAHVHTTLFPGHNYTFSSTLDFERYVGDAAPPSSGGDSAVGGTTKLKGKAWVTAMQEKYRRLGHDLGPSGVDGIDGPRFVEITRHEQRMAGPNGNPGGALEQDGIAGDKTNAYVDWWLNGHPAPAAAAPSYPVVNLDNIASIGDVRGLQKVARTGGYKGGIDNQWGPGSKGGLQGFLNRNYGGSLVTWLRKRWGYVGDDRLGPQMIAALQRANAENFRAL